MIRRTNASVIAALVTLVSISGLTAEGIRGVSITEGRYEERPHFIIATETATWWFDKNGGGFSRLIDRSGTDWIAFKKEPLSQFPASAAAGYRGIPNAVFGRGNPDAGAGHPGFDQCRSTLESTNTIRSVSRSGDWVWTWSFHSTHARMTVERVDPDHPFWFLYEGPIGGSWSPATHYWGTNQGGPRRDRPDIKQQLFGRWRWVYFGDHSAPRALFVAQVKPDDVLDTVWYLGAQDGGSIDAADGMVVFGFGRGPGARPLLCRPQSFVVAFYERSIQTEADHATAGAWIESLIE